MVDVIDLDVLSDECFEKSLQLIHQLTGITIATNRKTMVQGRLRKRVSTLHLKSYDEYLELVKSSQDEKIIFVDLVTTNETYFFRTPRIWQYLSDVYLPKWFASNQGKVFFAWSAASSSGEEAHSIGIICHAFKEKNPSFQYQIVGTDISREMVQLCQAGVYKGRSIESFQASRPDWFMKYMKSVENSQFQIVPEIKLKLKFSEHNLFKHFNYKDRFDLVLLRNVLIYFTAPDQEKVLTNILPKLTDKGLLIIGESESLTHINTGFTHQEPLIYRKTAQNPIANEAA